MSSYPVRDEAAPKRLGRYELIGHLATGGMAEIHLARLAGEGGFETVCVVKRLLPELVASPTYVSMFLDEGKLVSRLSHPNICEVYELGKDAGEYYLAMPYLDGVAAHELIARPRDPDRTTQIRVAAGVIAQACAGLHHAHELRDADGAPAGLVHRDVSPSNLFVMSSGVVKVLDFGVAKVRGATETEVGTIKGKQQYMPPEQLLGEPLDRRCDVFALGIVLFELATHSRLFKRASDYLTAKAVLEEPIPRADSIDPAVPTKLADVIEKALARDRDKRFSTAAELADAVAGAIDIGTPEMIAATVVGSDELSAMRTRRLQVLEHAKADTTLIGGPTVKVRAVDRPPWVRVVIPAAALLVVAGIVAGVAVKLRGGDPKPTPDTTVAVASKAMPIDTAVADPIDAVVAAVEIDAVIVDAEEIEMPVDDGHGPARPAKPGMLSIDSTPWATIYVDGKSLGITPIVKRSLPAGRHKLRAVLKDGREKEQSITIPAGALAKPIQLIW